MDKLDMKAKLLEDLLETMLGMGSGGEEESKEGVMGEEKPMDANVTMMAIDKGEESSEEEGEEDPLMKMKKAKMMGM